MLWISLSTLYFLFGFGFAVGAARDGEDSSYAAFLFFCWGLLLVCGLTAMLLGSIFVLPGTLASWTARALSRRN